MFFRLLIFSSSADQFSIALPFYFFSFLPLLLGLLLFNMCAGGEMHAPEAQMPFLSSLVSSPSTAQTTTGDLWSAGVSPPAEAGVRSAMADREPGLFPQCVFATKGKVRNARRIHAPLPPAASRLRAAQRGFGPKMAPATETAACTLLKP